ncbi:MAG: tRNA preQ1(34) S-adenosylmethionine ribosyltransferase-isomerase QueA [Anaerolineae bacterium]|nr:tRNA preQ1(34) S-adenosylmethionine ribosyltransferase-isomerase QueA [Anaerolineae bacterium]
MKTSAFDYALPASYIAQTPVEPRDSSRLLVVDRATRTLTHRIFRDVGEYLRPGDLLVANESRVLPARLSARKLPTGGKVELLLLVRRDARTWEALVRGRKTPVGTRLALLSPDDPGAAPVALGDVVDWTSSGARVIRWQRPIDDLLDELGLVPLPPYVHTPLSDPERYQTVYARRQGSVAAPTAGLHFTPELLIALRRQGVQMAFVELDIGLDTFRPVESERVEDHKIHTERCALSPDVARQVNQARLEGRRIVAVGTTSVRVLETAAQLVACAPDAQEGSAQACAWQTVRAFSGPTDLFIYPGFAFRVVDALITNFHLPRSSLLMLVSAFADRDLILAAYKEAVREGYRFYSFGDAMLIL